MYMQPMPRTALVPEDAQPAPPQVDTLLAALLALAESAERNRQAERREADSAEATDGE